MKKNNESHEFALFVDSDSFFVNSQARTLMLKDLDAINRILTIVRLTVGENVILFDQKITYSCTIIETSKKNILLSLRNQQEVQLQLPVMDIVVPLLERDALEDVVYMATVYGVRKIYLIATDKSRKKLTEKDLFRLRKISISAAEQSKQFFLPTLEKIVTFEDFLTKDSASYSDSIKLWCDISGTPILEFLAKNSKSKNNYVITFGPEGDFTHQEKELLAKTFTPIKLSKNILRAKDAASLVMGIVRSDN